MAQPTVQMMVDLGDGNKAIDDKEHIDHLIEDDYRQNIKDNISNLENVPKFMNANIQ